MTEVVDTGTGEVVEGRTVAALAVREPQALVRPAADLAEVRQAFEEYEQLCSQLLTKDDYQQIGDRRFRKRSGWRKLGVAFSVNFELVEKTILRDDQGRVTYAEFVYRAVAPNGRHVDGWGACDHRERCCDQGCSKRGRHKHCPAATGKHCPGWTHFSHANHDIPATAETRAKNRAAADLFGMGEVSAEEVVGDGEASSGDTREQTKEQQDRLTAVLDEIGKTGVEPLNNAESWLAYAETMSRTWFDRAIADLDRGQMETFIGRVQAYRDTLGAKPAAESEPVVDETAEQIPFGE